MHETPFMNDTPDHTIFTTVVHAGSIPRDSTGSLTTPIYRTSVFGFDDLDTAAAVHDGREPGYFYGRLGNPTQTAMEQAIAQLEGAESAFATASGMAAIAYALLAILETGDEIVAQPMLYTTTRHLFDEFLADHGITVRYAPSHDAADIVSTFTDATKVVYIETPSNPTLDVVDLAAVAAAARSRRIVAVADNTFATPFNQNPLALGFDVVCHSATKYIGGHGDLMAGVLAGSAEIVHRARWKVNTLLGAVISPDSAWLVLRGLKTLAVRMERHNASALDIAHWLTRQPGVNAVNYPGLPTHPGHDIASNQMRGFGGMVSFSMQDAQAAAQVVNSVRLCTLGVSLGDVATLIQVSSAMSQASLTSATATEGLPPIPPGLIRLSVGLESVEDIKQDLSNALQV